MISKEKKTFSEEGGQPVRFYKFVALTFLSITVVLLGLIVFMSSKHANVTVTTRPESVDTTFSVDIVKVKANNKQMAGVVTSTVVNLNKSFNPKGVRKEQGAATGRVTLYNDGSVSQPLVATTRLLTADGILFRLKSRALVPAGGSVEAEVYADQKGPESDIEPSDFTIPGLGKTLQKIIYAKSTQAMSGGTRLVGVVSKEDFEQAEQLLIDDMKKLGDGQLSGSFEGKKGVFTVEKKVVESNVEIGEETDEFDLKGQMVLVGVFYDEEELKQYSSAMLEKQLVDSSEIIHSNDPAPSVILEDYDLAKGVAVLSVTYSGMVSLNPNSRELQKIMFFGKTEDEIRRYVLSLDHVNGVEINFRPIWNRSVPHVADHVNIIVRQVE